MRHITFDNIAEKDDIFTNVKIGNEFRVAKFVPTRINDLEAFINKTIAEWNADKNIKIGIFSAKFRDLGEFTDKIEGVRFMGNEAIDSTPVIISIDDLFTTKRGAKDARKARAINAEQKAHDMQADQIAAQIDEFVQSQIAAGQMPEFAADWRQF